MAARDRWTNQNRCPQCGAESEVRWSEDDHRWMRNDTRQVDSVDAPLYAKRVAADHPVRSLEIWCRDCDCETEVKTS